jgi:hypothetical protein
VGAGWSVTGPDPSPSAIALKFEVPWDRANEKHRFVIELLDADGEPVPANQRSDGDDVEEVQGVEGVRLEGEFETGRPAGLKPGTPLDFMAAVNLPPQPLEPGNRYVWKLWINGETHDEWAASFSVRPRLNRQQRRAS